MNLTRTHTIVLSSKEVREALKSFWPDNMVIQSMPDQNGPVEFAMNGNAGCLSITIRHEIPVS